MANLTLNEMQIDLANTESDIQALASIVGALDIFITRNGGEDRSGFKTDRLKYSALLAQAHKLKDKIQFAILDANAPTTHCPPDEFDRGQPG